MSKTIIIIGCFFIAGCNSLSVEGEKTSSASYVGDSRSIASEEVVVSVPMSDQANQYQNLHVFISVIVNPKKSSLYQHEITDIIRRSRTRVSSVVVQELLSIPRVSAGDLASIRKQLVSKAQQSLDSILSQWAYSNEYNVEVAIVSIFLTDNSVGKEASPNRFWD